MNYFKKEVCVIDNIEITNCLPEIGLENTQKEILEGLLQSSKYISSKFFYNEKGSQLFEDITRLKEYYPTRTEMGILKTIAPGIMHNLRETDIIELGSGDCSKISVLLDQVAVDNLATLNYFPVDFSASAMEQSAEILVEKFPNITIQGFVADFMKQLHVLPYKNKRLICFFGSTIGNLNRKQAGQMMVHISDQMKPGDKLLLGLDLVKPRDILHAAYNDGADVTAAFNKNILNSVNAILGTHMKPDNFEHLAFYNEEKSRIEMHLVALLDMEIYAPTSPTPVVIKKGEHIHTENSHKHTQKEVANFAEVSGLHLCQLYTDSSQWFGLAEYEKK